MFVRKMNIANIDHIVLTVRDINKTVKFYESVLGMVSESFESGRIALKFGRQKINGSSEKFMGDFFFRKSAKCMI